MVTLAKEMKKQQLDAIQYLPDAYDQQFLESYGDLFEGSVVRTDFTQFELPRTRSRRAWATTSSGSRPVRTPPRPRSR